MSDLDKNEKIVAISNRIDSILKSRPALRLFSNHTRFLLRYGQATDINPSLSVIIPYTEIVNADDSKLRELIQCAIPRKSILLADIDIFTHKQSTLLGLLHNAADSHQWGEVQELNSKLKWVSSELIGLRVTLCTIE